MIIDWAHFTPWSALAGGLLVGLAAALFAVMNGRVAGTWDPSLALVMAGAIAVAYAGFHFGKRMQATLLQALMQLPSRTRIDRRLILGSLAFGAGWGVSGFCPGPALVVLGSGELKAAVFVLAMLAGMAIHWFFVRERAR